MLNRDLFEMKKICAEIRNINYATKSNKNPSKKKTKEKTTSSSITFEEWKERNNVWQDPDSIKRTQRRRSALSIKHFEGDVVEQVENKKTWVR